MQQKGKLVIFFTFLCVFALLQLECEQGFSDPSVFGMVICTILCHEFCNRKSWKIMEKSRNLIEMHVYVELASFAKSLNEIFFILLKFCNSNQVAFEVRFNCVLYSGTGIDRSSGTRKNTSAAAKVTRFIPR